MLLSAAAFSVFDEHGEGAISTEYVPALLEKLGRDATEGAMNQLDTSFIVLIFTVFTLDPQIC